MSITDEGKRRVHFHRRQLNAKREAQGDPLLFDSIPRATRTRISLLLEKHVPIAQATEIVRELRIECEKPDGLVPTIHGAIDELAGLLVSSPTPIFCSGLEAIGDGIGRMYRTKPNVRDAVLGEFQAVLAEDFVGYRYRWNQPHQQYDIERIDNPHLHKEIIDRTFELTTKHAFAGAQNDYSEARGHYSKGEFADAIFKSGKAYESALKAILDKMGVTYKKETAAALAKLAIDNGLISSRLQTFISALNSMMTQGPNTLRNQAGVGHGSADLVGPEASLASLVLNLTGSLIVFLVEEWERK